REDAARRRDGSRHPAIEPARKRLARREDRYRADSQPTLPIAGIPAAIGRCRIRRRQWKFALGEMRRSLAAAVRRRVRYWPARTEFPGDATRRNQTESCGLAFGIPREAFRFHSRSDQYTSPT